MERFVLSNIVTVCKYVPLDVAIYHTVYYSVPPCTAVNCIPNISPITVFETSCKIIVHGFFVSQCMKTWVYVLKPELCKCAVYILECDIVYFIALSTGESFLKSVRWWRGVRRSCLQGSSSRNGGMLSADVGWGGRISSERSTSSNSWSIPTSSRFMKSLNQTQKWC